MLRPRLIPLVALLLAVPKLHAQTSVFAQSDNTFVVLLSSDRATEIWRYNVLAIPLSISVSPDGIHAYVATRRQQVVILNKHTGKSDGQFSVPRPIAAPVAFNPDGSRVYVPLEPDLVWVANAAGTPIASINVNKGRNSVWISGDGKRGMIAGLSKVSVFDPSTNKLTGEIYDALNNVGLTPARALVVAEGCVQQGASCLTLTTDDNRLYSLGGAALPAVGQRVRIQGLEVETPNLCQQGVLVALVNWTATGTCSPPRQR
jgi:DNA-binding beta-propeller fold protein YncE